jgi:hypothetical protein
MPILVRLQFHGVNNAVFCEFNLHENANMQVETII